MAYMVKQQEHREFVIQALRDLLAQYESGEIDITRIDDGGLRPAKGEMGEVNIYYQRLHKISVANAKEIV